MLSRRASTAIAQNCVLCTWLTREPSPWLTVIHQVHHADLDYDLTTGARFHPIEIALSMLIKFATITVLAGANNADTVDLTLDDLVQRVRALQPDEVIVATSISVEGEATASYIQHLLRGQPVRLSRIASGVPQGSDLEYLDQGTLGRALRSRQVLGGGRG